MLVGKIAIGVAVITIAIEVVAISIMIAARARLPVAALLSLTPTCIPDASEMDINSARYRNCVQQLYDGTCKSDLAVLLHVDRVGNCKGVKRWLDAHRL